MDLRLGLSLSRSQSSCDYNIIDLNVEDEELQVVEIMGSVKKRHFKEEFDYSISDDHIHTPQTLPLLSWNNDNLDEQQIEIINQEMYGVVGWPPMNSVRRRKTAAGNQNRDGTIVNPVPVENGGIRRNNSVLVKVKMEGFGIARKVDLCLHHSYHTLLQTLLAMFGKQEESVDAYKLFFQDKDGFWHLAEDVTWGNLIKSVNRLHMRKKG